MTLIDTKTFGVLDCEMKQVKASPSGEFEAILSVPTVDRDGEVVDAKAFEPLPDYIPIDIDHGMSVESTVGSGTPFYDGDVLKFRGSFASTPLGQQVRSLVVEGHVRKMSRRTSPPPRASGPAAPRKRSPAPTRTAPTGSAKRCAARTRR
jgi:hypothetical protein